MQTASDLDSQIDRLGAAALKIADERNACHAAARAMLKALKYARNHILNPENTDTNDLLKVIYAAWDDADAAGIKVER